MQGRSCPACGSKLEGDALAAGICPTCSTRTDVALNDAGEAPTSRVGPGRSLSHFRLLERIGAGGMGVVFRARDEHLRRDVAVKILPEGVIGNEALRKRLRKEALALSKLNHPSIETIHDFDTQHGIDFLVVEYIAGVTLHEKLRGGPLGEADVLRLGLQLADGLHAAHGHGVIHCDLKPANLKLTPDDRLKILDFGLARLVRPVTASVTTMTAGESTAVAGTVPYMAPEQLRGEKVDARTDVWALGAVLYEMATGERAFGAEILTALAADIQTKPPAAPRAVNPRLSVDVERLILRCLEKDPEQRYPSAGEVAAELRRLREGRSVRGRLRRRAVSGALAGVGLVAIAAVGFDLGGIRMLLSGGAAIRSLAVLPFVNTTGDPETEYLSDGITESIIQDVSQIPDLLVIARSSVFHYKGQEIEPAQVARELDVRAVLTGRMTLRGEALQVSAELVDTRDNRHLWGERYDRSLADILALQEDIAGHISDGLRARLSPADRTRLARLPTTSTEAYQLYLKGRFQLNAASYTEVGARRALEYFRQAVETDPGYALGHVGIGEAYYLLSNIFLKSEEAMPRTREAARKALELDPDLGEAEALLAMVTALYDWKWDEAEASFRRANRLAPGYALSHMWFGNMLMMQGRAREALAELGTARSHDPLSPLVSWYAAWPFLYAPPEDRRPDLAIRAARKVLDMDPSFYVARNTLALAYQQTGQFEEAVAECERALEASDRQTTFTIGLLAHAHAAAGHRAKAEQELRVLDGLRETTLVSAYVTALVYVALGDVDQAFVWLERSFENREEELPTLGVDPRVDVLRDDPRLQDMLRRLGLSTTAPRSVRPQAARGESPRSHPS